jgi:hypothetical protein
MDVLEHLINTIQKKRKGFNWFQQNLTTTGTISNQVLEQLTKKVLQCSNYVRIPTRWWSLWDQNMP